MSKKTTREILVTSKAFKQFWKKRGPYKYALTSAEYPPVLLEPEEWIFSDDMVDLLKALMKWEERKMKTVPAPFNPKKKNILKPEALSPWKINHFPEEWEMSVCDSFTPVGHLTDHVAQIALNSKNEGNGNGAASDEDPLNEGAVDFSDIDIPGIERAFFTSLEADVEKIGYVLLKPEHELGPEDSAYIKGYLEEWESDEDEAL